MTEFKTPKIDFELETDTLCEPLGITDERHKELVENAQGRVSKLAEDSNINQLHVLKEFVKDCKNVEELSLMSFHAGTFVEKVTNQDPDLSSLLKAMTKE